MPVRDVAVDVGDIPNNVGTFYSVQQRTGLDGTATFGAIPAGVHRVAITLPTGFAPDMDGLVRQVTVVKNATVTVAFRVIRQ
jgi:hypothetical protein